MSNQVRPFTLDEAEVHGRLVKLNSALDDILGKHAYPPLVENLLAEMLVLTTALASTLKFEGILTLQIRGDGPISTIVADVQTEDEALNLRGYAGYDEERLNKLSETDGDQPSIPKLVGEGSLAFTLDQGENTERYQGIVALEGATLTDCLTHYFAQSDQFSMAIKLATNTQSDKRKGCALTLQRLPDIGGKVSKSAEEIEDDWRRTVMLMGTAKDTEMLDADLSADDLLFRLYHEDGVRVFNETPVRAKCRCSKDRIFSALKGMSADDLDHAQTDGKIEVVCEFCADAHIFDVEKLHASAA